MVRSVSLNEEALEAVAAACRSGNGANVGVVLGSLGENKDVVVSLVDTPGLQVKEGKIQPDEADLMLEHARMLRRMLPGGVEVIGLFNVAFSDKHKEVATKFFPYLQKLRTSGNENERLLVQICARTHKATCKSVDVSARVADFRPAELKAGKLAPPTMLSTRLSVRLKLVVPLGTPGDFSGAVRPALGMVKEELDKAGVVVNGSETDLEKDLSSLDRSAQADFYLGGGGSFFTTVDARREDQEDDEEQKVVMLSYEGTITGCAYGFNSKAKMGSLVDLLREDLLKSIVDRVAVLTEDYDMSVEEGKVEANPFRDANEMSANEWWWSLPRRVFTSYKWGLAVCDYVLPEEDFQDCVERFQDMIGVTYAEGSASPITDETFTEPMTRQPKLKAPKGKTLAAPAGTAKKTSAQSGGSTQSQGPGNMVPMIAAAVAGLGALVIGSMYT